MATGTRDGGGFTMIEMIGLLAVIAVLALLVLSASIAHIDRVVSDQEIAQLKTMGQAFQDSVQQNRYIPGMNDWAQIIAPQMGVNPSTVSTNARGRARVFLVDPQIQVGVNGGGLPYTQTASGSVVGTGFVTNPISPRVLILSSLGTALPTNLDSSSDFTNVWNAASGAVPAGSHWSRWGSGNDLIIQRINLSPLFVRLTLNNYPGQSRGQYQIDSSTINLVPWPPSSINAFFLKNTVLQLYNQNTVNPVADSRQILTADSSFVYSGGAWHTGLGAPTNSAPDFTSTEANLIAATADQFVNAPWNTNATSGTRQSDVLARFSDYMNAYNAWANSAPNPPKSGPLYTAAKNAQSVLSSTMSSLVQGATPHGCK